MLRYASGMLDWARLVVESSYQLGIFVLLDGVIIVDLQRCTRQCISPHPSIPKHLSLPVSVRCDSGYTIDCLVNGSHLDTEGLVVAAHLCMVGVSKAL